MVLDRDILLLIVAHFAQPLPKGGCIGCRGIGGPTVDKCDHGWRRLLRPRCDWPHRYRASERCNKLAPPHSITSSARESSDGGTVRPSTFAVLRLITVSYLVGACTGRSAGFSPLRMRSA